jgi:hypothetical protein
MARQLELKTVHDPKQLMLFLNSLATDVNLLIVAVNEINTWAETLATKLNLDNGVTDTNYDATITAPQITASTSTANG